MTSRSVITLYPASTGARLGEDAVRFLVDDGEPTLTQGFGGWETISRPQQVALTRFTGNDPIGQSVPILVDGYRTDQDIMPVLERLLRQSRVQEDEAPTIWRIEGPIFYPNRRWIVAGIEFGETLRSRRSGPGGESSVLSRQRATLNLLEYVPSDQVRVRRVERKFKRKGKKARVQADGRSIRQLAVKYYGTSRLDVARALGKAQKPPIRDIKKKLGEKRQIRLPVLKV